MSVELKPHNQEAYNKVKEAFETSNKTAVIHPTGTGKSYIAMKLIEENQGKKAIYLAPSVGILLQLKTPEGQTIKMTYQTLARLDDEEIKKLGVDIIVLDEFHHCGAPIWGEAVQKLINAFPNAKVLGLSATPIRYFDGNIDMAEKLFGDNIASEISFEEAIEKEILPPFDYVSALYGADDSLRILKQRIDSKNSIAASKKEEAYRLYDEIKNKLEKSAVNLPNVLKKHIPNPDGKYIIFCRNQDDLQNKIEEVRKLFGEINTNIDVYSVSSYETSQKNEGTISEFTENKKPNTLKLMFAINMLNEGFHLPDIDGVIMMRPTMSPTIYQQQMGRALSCSNEGKRPVIIDLVDNFNSIKVIEDFYEKMSKLKPNGEGREETESERKIRLYDYLEDTNEIIDKIQKLSRMKSLTIEEKVNLFEEYLNDENTDDIIISDTIYEGYPIGMYLISIRSELNNEEKAKKYSKEIVKKLENLGLLEDRNESTIDEKIDRLIQFVQNNPELWKLNKGRNIERTIDKFLGENTDKEKRKELIKQLELANKDYEYIRTRKSQGKLAEEDIKRLKDAGVGRVFGETTRYELQKQEFIDKYEIEPEIYDLIIKKYGSIDNFKKIYVDALIKGNVQETIDKKILNNCNLVKLFDISSPDWVARNTELTDLIHHMISEDKIFVKYEGIDEKITELLLKKGAFTEQEVQVISILYGLNGENRKNKTQVANSIGKSLERVRQIEAKTIRKLVSPMRLKHLDMKNRVLDIDYDLQKKIIEEYFNNFDVFVSREPTSMDEETKNKLTKMLSDAVEKTQKRNEQVEIIKKMPEEQQIEILKARFGDKINSSDLSIIPPWDIRYERCEEENGIEIDKQSLANRYLFPYFYKECVDSDFTQTKIAEFIINNATNSELAEPGKKAELEGIIEKSEYFSEEKKSELKELLNERIRLAVKEKILMEMEAMNPYGLDMTIEELDLSVRSYNVLCRGGFKTVEDLIGKSDEDLRTVRNMGKNSFDEIIEKLKSMGIELEDGVLSIKDKEQIDDMNENKRMQLEEEIDNSDVLTEEEKETLRKKLDEKYNDVKAQRKGLGEENLRSEILNAVRTNFDSIKEMTIEELEFSVRTFNCLKRAGVNTVSDIIKKTEDELLHIRNLGQTGYEETIEKLKVLGLEFIEGNGVDYRDSEPDIKKLAELEEKINTNEYFSEEKKEELREFLYEQFKVPRPNNQQEQSNENELEKTEIEEFKIEKIEPENAKIEENETEENQEEIEQENEEPSEEQIQPTKEQKAMQLENIIQELKQAYITLGQRDKELQVAIQERVEELERVRSEKITTEEKLHKLEKIVEENRQFFKELGELESFEPKIQNTLNELEGKRQEEKGIEETIEDLRKQQEEVQNQKEEIKKQIHDITQDL